ncbi:MULTISPECIES: tautomerase family protein [unclassified Variovorax]|uniref:tautomerase family protein n=1 Tax=unclassified Variovorax TaxID=663243 RepID=UPI002577A40F|nr:MULTISPECIES: tautomerase family protein [unclassified Variovorax]MDM0091669.1 tautomerase family protein [Variovorax sp. J22G40]MDM0146026.1 tautomerase family protein [Variovorax sp. J2P1-31]
MPLWNIYHPVGAYTAEDKQEMATRIKDAHSAIPKFYVGVLFQEIPKDSFYMGAEQRDNFVRLRVDIFARHISKDAVWTESFLRKMNEAIEPFVQRRGYNYELHVGETPRELWLIDGIHPPKPDTVAEKRWRLENRASPFEPEEG